MVTSILGGMGLFLLGMWVMTDGLRAVAGSALRKLLSSAAATPARGTLWGTIVTLIVQSSSATTMTTIGLVSAGLLTFPQALGVILGANVGTTGTGWLVALLGVNVSLTPAAMPMILAGALLRLLGRGRWAGAGGAVAGFALLLLGLTVLQDGMAGLAEHVNPEDLPSVGGEGWWRGTAGIAQLVVVGILMTTVMQSSSAAVVATISALHAGAVGPDQAAALVIGQNIGSTVSSVLAAVGATTAAKRTALAHVLFNVATGGLILTIFPLLVPVLVRTAANIDPPILLALFHTTYNLLGVAIFLPALSRLARLVERVIPQREQDLTRFLDRASLEVPGAAVEAARRTVAGSLSEACNTLVVSLRYPGTPGHTLTRTAHDASEAFEQTRMFLSEMSVPPGTDQERARLANVLHALDHASRLMERIEDWASEPRSAIIRRDSETARAVSIAIAALEQAVSVVRAVATPRRPAEAEPGIQGSDDAMAASERANADEAGVQSRSLTDLRSTHRARILAAAAYGESGVTAAEAIARTDAVRILDKMAYHAWRSAAHLVGIDAVSLTDSHTTEPTGEIGRGQS